ncbi:MAG: T9SS type A sorting domain-containing protein [Bacteroidales bacterium]|nr:T9SS type A sorting domain-containing protein [Bacteroidales bacterium]MCF8398403.1 T9SS type A sorting domain-containing protein [Bacteroidales bacterium]
MKTQILLFTFIICMSSVLPGQNTIELTFTAIDSVAYVQLDSIKVMNRSQGGDTVLYYPDTILILDFPVGLPEVNMDDKGFRVFQNYPNPVAEQTTVSLYAPEKDNVSIMLTDILGRVIVKSERVLDKGRHTFRFIPGSGKLYFFTATWQGRRSSIKILQNNPGSYNTGVLEYIGYESSSSQLKTTKDILSFPFSLGDELLYIGYSDTLQSGMLDSPKESVNYTFQFATNIPCPGTPTVTYEGQVYNTIQIFSQCWLKENLNVGTMIQGSEDMADNDTIEKYCYNNEPDSCTKYGGLYQRNEVMQYTNQQGTQGICPPGWHLPTDEEWKVLEGAVDSQYWIGDPEWDDYWAWRGYDAGKNLKTTSGWNDNGNGTDLFGFSGLPGGGRIYYGDFNDVGYYGTWWSSGEKFSHWKWLRGLSYNGTEVHRYTFGYYFVYGFSVRCLKDE